MEAEHQRKLFHEEITYIIKMLNKRQIPTKSDIIIIASHLGKDNTKIFAVQHYVTRAKRTTL